MSVTLQNGKKLKTSNKVTSASNAFYPYRALGFITDDKPFVVQIQHEETFCITSIYKSFQIFKCDHLNVIQVSPPHKHKIRALATIRKNTYVAAGNTLYRWKNKKIVRSIEHGDYKVNLLTVFTENFLISVCENSILKVWTKFLEERVSIDLKPYHISAVIHPSTYINKVLVATREGILQLWNLHSKELIYEFKHWQGTSITCLVEAPAIDVVAIGLADGRIIVHNIKFDKTVMSFQQAEGAVTSLSFRTDRTHVLASGTNVGSVALWDLNEKKLITVMSNAHSSAITCVKFLHGEPVMMTSGADNALKMWIFDNTDGTARLLRFRSGHSQPPTILKNYPKTPVMITTGPDQQLRTINVQAPRYNFQLSKGKTLAKTTKTSGVSFEDVVVGPILDLDSSIIKEDQWDNVVTCHNDSTVAYTWNSRKKTIGKNALRVTSPKQGSIKTVAISTCGNFALLGTNCGWIDVYNIQSGLHRGKFPPKGGHAHKAPVTSLFTDSLNQYLISTSLDGTIKVWDFKTHKLEKTIKIDSPINKAAFLKDSSLMAIMPDDFSIRIYDIDTQTMVRRFEGHTGVIDNAVFSPDARWLVSSSADGTLRVWDIPSGQMIDWYTSAKPITSIGFTPTGNFLVTTHVGSVGIYMWANSSYYSNYIARPASSTPKKLLLPGAISEEEHLDSSDAPEEEEEENTNGNMDISMDLDSALTEPKEGLITLSDLPEGRWISIPDWEQIKKRNKPKEPVKKPEKTPFFLPTVAALDGSFKFAEPEKKEDEDESEKLMGSSRIIRLQDDLNTKSKFVQLLTKAEETNDYTEALALLKEMTAPAIDFEFRTLSLQDDYKELKMVLKMLSNLMDTNQNFEILQAYMNLFLKIHGDMLSQDEQLMQLMTEVKAKQSEKWLHLQYMFQNTLCLIKFFSGIQMN